MCLLSSYPPLASFFTICCMVYEGDYVPKNAGTIFSSAEANRSNGPRVTKRITNRLITPKNSITNTYIPHDTDDVKTYIERMRKTEKLNNLARMSNDILYRCQTVFPFDFFPDILIIDKTKINLIIKQFFFTETVHSIMIKNVQDIQVETSVLFAKMIIVPEVYIGQAITMAYLNKECALEARRIIQGLMLCYKEGIDISDLDASAIKNKIETAGTAVEVKYAG